MEDEQRSIKTIFWLLLMFAFSMAVLSAGAAWAYLEWIGYLERGLLWLAAFVLSIGFVGAISSFVGVLIWLVREARSPRPFEL